MVALIDIQGLGDALRAVADSISKLGDALAHIVQLGTSGLDEVLARRTRSRLKDIDARLTTYFIGQSRVSESLDAYIQEMEAWKKWSPTPEGQAYLAERDRLTSLSDRDELTKQQEWESFHRRFRGAPRLVHEFDWEWVIRKIKGASDEVDVLLNDLKQERSDFVLDSVYVVLLDTLSTRRALFDRLLSGPEPSAAEELTLLREASKEWDRLRRELKRATVNMSAYLKDDETAAAVQQMPLDRASNQFSQRRRP